MNSAFVANFLDEKDKKRNSRSHKQDNKSARKILQSEDSDTRGGLLVLIQDATFDRRLIALDPVHRQARIRPPLHPIKWLYTYLWSYYKNTYNIYLHLKINYSKKECYNKLLVSHWIRIAPMLSVKENTLNVSEIIHVFARDGKFAVASFFVQLVKESIKQELTLHQWNLVFLNVNLEHV